RVACGIFVLRGYARVWRIDWNAGTLTVDLELFDGVWSLQVSSHQQWSVAFLLQVFGKLPGERGFTSTLQSDEHNDRWRIFGDVNLPSLTAENILELALDNLDHLLAGIERFRNFLAERTFFYLLDELTHGWDCNVSIEQRTANFSCRCINIRLCESAFTSEVFKGCG